MSGFCDPGHELDEPLAEQLARERPTPRGSFRGALSRYLTAEDPGYGPRPARLRPVVAAYVLTGLVLILGGLVLALATG
jgi:hypothetical protein